MKATVVYNREVSPGLFRMSIACDKKVQAGSPGQFVMVRGLWGADPLLSRPFSVYRYKPSNDADGVIQLLIKRAGKGTDLLTRLSPGDDLSVQGPLGNGFPDVTPVGRLFLVGGGIGIAPMMAVAESLPTERLKKTLLVFGGKGAGDISGIDDDIGDVGVETIYVTEDGSRGVRGTVMDILEGDLSEDDVVFACGPRGMLRAISQLSGRIGSMAFVSHEERMACGVGLCLGCAAPTDTGSYALTCKDGPVFEAQSIRWEEL